jgi:hypothetical protein
MHARRGGRKDIKIVRDLADSAQPSVVSRQSSASRACYAGVLKFKNGAITYK